MQRFNKVSVEGTFIKALLYNTPIPNIQTVMTGDYMVAGYSYIYNYDVVYCNSSGIVMDNGGSRMESDGLATWTYLYEYNPKDHYILFAERYMSKYNYYDPETHEWLGKYLRYYRGLTGVDLMPFYNCFSNTQVDNIKINSDTREVYKHYVQGPFKVYKVPVRFNQKYTIAIDCPAPVKIAWCFMDQNNLLDVKIGKGDNINKVLWAKDKAINTFEGMSFRHPVMLEMPNQVRNNEQYLKLYENDLYLLIQLPIDNDSSIVVLEGDYRNLDKVNIFSYDRFEDIMLAKQNQLMLSKLSLLKFNDKSQHPYAPRLVEYLTGQAITSEDQIPKNIYRINQLLTDGNHFKLQTAKFDVWWDDTRFGIYKYQCEDSKAERIDMNGFMDKDTEFRLVKEQEVREAEEERKRLEAIEEEKRANYGYWSNNKYY